MAGAVMVGRDLAYHRAVYRDIEARFGGCTFDGNFQLGSQRVIFRFAGCAGGAGQRGAQFFLGESPFQSADSYRLASRDRLIGKTQKTASRRIRGKSPDVGAADGDSQRGVGGGTTDLD